MKGKKFKWIYPVRLNNYILNAIRIKYKKLTFCNEIFKKYLIERFCQKCFISFMSQIDDL